MAALAPAFRVPPLRSSGKTWRRRAILFRLLSRSPSGSTSPAVRTRAASASACLGALLLASAGAAQSGEAPADARPTEGEYERELGVEASHEIGAPLGRPLSGAALDQAAAEVAADIRCPKCQALSIADSGAASAQAMRAEARSLLAQGYTREQVVAYFEQRYGEFVLLEPRARGLNLVVWTAPGAIVLLGGLLVARRLRQRQRGGEETLDTYLRQVEREIAT